jgi:hypothetical protein
MLTLLVEMAIECSGHQPQQPEHQIGSCDVIVIMALSACHLRCAPCLFVHDFKDLRYIVRGLY